MKRIYAMYIRSTLCRAKESPRSQQTRRRQLERMVQALFRASTEETKNATWILLSQVVLAFVTVPGDFPISDETRSFLRHWLQIWNTPDLAARTRIEVSQRLTRSVGRLLSEPPPHPHLLSPGTRSGRLAEGDEFPLLDGISGELSHPPLPPPPD